MKKAVKPENTKKPYEKPTLQKRERLDQVVEGGGVTISGVFIPGRGT